MWKHRNETHNGALAQGTVSERRRADYARRRYARLAIVKPAGNAWGGHPRSSGLRRFRYVKRLVVGSGSDDEGAPVGTDFMRSVEKR
jgi:hypothetical protein